MKIPITKRVSLSVVDDPYLEMALFVDGDLMHHTVTRFDDMTELAETVAIFQQHPDAMLASEVAFMEEEE